MSGDDLLFPALGGGPQSPNNLSGDWREFRLAAKVANVGAPNRHDHTGGHEYPRLSSCAQSHSFRMSLTRRRRTIDQVEYFIRAVLDNRVH
jgi:hypothetical protein